MVGPGCSARGHQDEGDEQSDHGRREKGQRDAGGPAQSRVASRVSRFHHGDLIGEVMRDGSGDPDLFLDIPPLEVGLLLFTESGHTRGGQVPDRPLLTTLITVSSLVVILLATHPRLTDHRRV
jgi:hypothetical protein